MPKPPLPDRVSALLAEPNEAVIATVRPDGQPVSVATWYLWEDGRILVNMDEGRKRLDYLRADPRVSLTVLDGNGWHTHVSLQGRVVKLADDTGLEVEALGGAPGVFTARFAGEGATYAENVARVLAEMQGVPPDQRGARFRTVALVHFPDGRQVAVEGAVAGTIADTARGDGGFGYDPVFIPEEGDGRTFAEMSSEEKHALSHRGRAFRALARALTD